VKRSHHGEIFRNTTTRQVSPKDAEAGLSAQIAAFNALPKTPADQADRWLSEADALLADADDAMRDDAEAVRLHAVDVSQLIAADGDAPLAGAMRAAMALGYKLAILRARSAGIERAAAIGFEAIERPKRSGMSNAAMVASGRTPAEIRKRAAREAAAAILEAEPRLSDQAVRRRVAQNLTPKLAESTVRGYLTKADLQKLRT